MQINPVVRLWAVRSIGICLLAVALAGCTATPAQPATPGPVTVSLTNFKLTASTTSAKAGDVTFVATNSAPDIQHELIVIKTDLPADKLVVGSDDRVDEESMTSMGEVSELDAGKNGTLTVNLAAGHYVLICNIAGHYRQGMYVDFTVNP
jgi:uncharacterized cupredoxin-like copper-binding protein